MAEDRNKVEAASSALTDQIKAAEAVIGIGVEANYLLDVLAGGGAGSRDAITMGVVDKTLEMLGGGIDIRSFIETPMEVDVTLPDDGLRIQGSYTLAEFWDQLFADSASVSFRDETRTTVETALADLSDWYSIIDEGTGPEYEAREAEARATIAELSPIREDLRSGQDDRNAEGLKAYNDLDLPPVDPQLSRLAEQIDVDPPAPRAPQRAADAVGTDDALGAAGLGVDVDRANEIASRIPSTTFREGMSAAEVRQTAIARAGAALERRLQDAERADDVAARVRADAIARANAEFQRTRPAPREMPGDNAAPVSARRPSEMPGDGAPPAPRPREMPGDGAPEWVTRMTQGRGPATGELTSQGYFGPGGHGMGDMVRAPSGGDGVVPTDPSVVTGGGGGGGGGAPRLTDAEIRDANQAEVELLLAQQFGGFSFFLQKHRSELQVGLTADGQVVAADDPNAATVKNVLDVIVDQGITAPTRVLGLLENTEWWKATDARMREYDVLTADMSEPQKAEYLEPVLDTLRDEAQFLGFQLDPTRARELAEQITRMGEEGDAEYIRGLLTAEEAFNAAEVSSSSFAAARDEIVAMSKRYFTPINEADAAAFAEDIYVGTKTAEGVEQYFREMAANKFPSMQNALDSGITPEQYFAPYKYEIERMLDRPNVDLYEEFGDIIQYIPDTGTGEARPMTLGEVRKYVRGLDEWQQSSQGKDSARALSFSIGKLFGEVA